jgi:hypothetical protein
MLFISLFFSGLLLLCANCVAFLPNRRIDVFLTIGVCLNAGLMGVMFFSPVVMLHTLLLLVTLIVWRRGRWRPGYFVLVSLGLTVVVFGAVSWYGFSHLQHLLGKYPYVSLEDRLPSPMAAAPAHSLPEDTAERLSVLEERIDGDYSNTRADPRRNNFLQQLHEESVNAFINQPGFGVTRMVGLSEVMLRQGLRDKPPLPQPGPRSTAAWSTEALKMQPLPRDGFAAEEGSLFQWHQASVIDFIHPGGFGYFKDRGHVAGFQEHQFSRVPEQPERWVLQTLDLVGLVVHDEPVVYVSDHLPRMDELRKVSTRPPDAFEKAGLEQLARGRDIFVADGSFGRRMLGAVRSVKQCLECHGGNRGDLLGAFSYTLVRER